MTAKPSLGAGVCAMLGSGLRPLAWWRFTIGILAHLFGMVGVRNLFAATGYHLPAGQVAVYWLCWAAVTAIVGYSLFKLPR